MRDWQAQGVIGWGWGWEETETETHIREGGRDRLTDKGGGGGGTQREDRIARAGPFF